MLHAILIPTSQKELEEIPKKREKMLERWTLFCMVRYETKNVCLEKKKWGQISEVLKVLLKGNWQ